MRREIKFRAWDATHQVMLEVYNIRFGDILQGRHEGPKSLHDCGGGIDAYILMQFTGLHDRHGKEIYEGDVVKWGHVKGGEEHPPRIAEVKICPDIEFHSQVGVFKFGAFIYTDMENWLEILGNIYEHPELRPVQEATRDG